MSWPFWAPSRFPSPRSLLPERWWADSLHPDGHRKARRGNAVIFSIDASATSVCSITSGVVSFTAVGSCVIDANQAGNVEFSPPASGAADRSGW